MIGYVGPGTKLSELLSAFTVQCTPSTYVITNDTQANCTGTGDPVHGAVEVFGTAATEAAPDIGAVFADPVEKENRKVPDRPMAWGGPFGRKKCVRH